jgi:hypothetical protein
MGNPRCTVATVYAPRIARQGGHPLCVSAQGKKWYGLPGMKACAVYVYQSDAPLSVRDSQS